MGYKLCKECGSPMLKAGQKRKHPDDYGPVSCARKYVAELNSEGEGE